MQMNYSGKVYSPSPEEVLLFHTVVLYNIAYNVVDYSVRYVQMTLPADSSDIVM